ncbi:hypothetical protein [Metabacillus sp. SLBN-84]
MEKFMDKMKALVPPFLFEKLQREDEMLNLDRKAVSYDHWSDDGAFTLFIKLEGGALLYLTYYDNSDHCGEVAKSDYLSLPEVLKLKALL